MIEEIYNKVITKVKTQIPKNAYLCHFFIMPNTNFNPLINDIDITDSEIHVGYFNRDTKRIFSYKLNGEDIELIPEQEIFQKKEEDVCEINVEDVNITVDTALDILREEIKQKYSSGVSFKTMIVLQKLKDLGLIWNITVLRRDFKTVNLKIDAIKGEIKKSSCESLIDLSKSK